MLQALSLTGSISGAIGILLCAMSGITRVSGSFYLLGYEATTIFMVGTGMMVLACLLKLELLDRRPN